MKKINLLIIGMGRASRQLSEYLVSKPWFHLAGVVDIDPEAQANACTYFKREDVPWYPDLDKALGETSADAVIINTHAWLHYEHAQKCLDAGLHVIVAKPFTHSFESALKLVDKAAKKSLKLCVAQQARYTRHFRSLNQFVQGNELGRISTASYINRVVRPDAGNLGDVPEPVLSELSSHHFDTILTSFEGSDPEWVMCHAYKAPWSPYEGHCMVDAMFAFEGGIQLLYHAGFSHDESKYEFHLQGEAGFLNCRGKHFIGAETEYIIGSNGKDPCGIDLEKRQPSDPAWSVFLDQWHRYLVGDEEPPFAGRGNLKIMAMIDAAIESSAKGERVALKDNSRYHQAFTPSTIS